MNELAPLYSSDIRLQLHSNLQTVESFVKRSYLHHKKGADVFAALSDSHPKTALRVQKVIEYKNRAAAGVGVQNDSQSFRESCVSGIKT